MKKIIFSYFFLLMSCSSGGRVITECDFLNISVGTTEKQLVSQLGQPNEVYQCENGDWNYEYIEKIEGNTRMKEEKYYYFIIRNGKVESKYMETKTRPPLQQRNSFELQTTYKNDTIKGDNASSAE